MFLNAIAMLAGAVLLSIAPPLHAAAPVTPKAAAYQCARAIHDQVGTGAFEVIRMSHPGRNHYRFWMNAHDGSVGAYCTTRNTGVAETFVAPTPWQGRFPRRPRSESARIEPTLTQAPATCACAADTSSGSAPR